MIRRNGWMMVSIYLGIVVLFFAMTYLGSTVTTMLAQKIPLERMNRIIIDPGHGGEDGGAISCTGIAESQYNLDIALRLNDLFQLLGYDTTMIRTTDRSVYISGDTIAAKKVSDLRQRAKIVNETEKGILVSIHQNTFQDGRYSGAQVFYGSKGESRDLAELVQRSIIDTINLGSNRQIKKADGIYLMEHIDRTGILVECGFLSNPEEEAKLRDPAYQKKLCVVICAATAGFLTK